MLVLKRFIWTYYANIMWGNFSERKGYHEQRSVVICGLFWWGWNGERPLFTASKVKFLILFNVFVWSVRDRADQNKSIYLNSRTGNSNHFLKFLGTKNYSTSDNDIPSIAQTSTFLFLLIFELPQTKKSPTSNIFLRFGYLFFSLKNRF